MGPSYHAATRVVASITGGLRLGGSASRVARLRNWGYGAEVAPLLWILACTEGPVASLVVDPVQRFVGRGPHRVAAAVLDAEGRELRAVPVRLSSTGAAHVERGEVWCDGSGAVEVVVRAAGLEEHVRAHCEYVAALRLVEPRLRLVVGERRDARGMVQALDAAGRPEQGLRVAWTSADPAVVDAQGRARKAGVTTMTFSAGGAAKVEAVLEVVERACIKVVLDPARPDGMPWDPDGVTEIGAWIVGEAPLYCTPGLACVHAAPSGAGCGPFRLRVVERDALVEGSSSDEGRSHDILLRLPTPDDADDDDLGEVTCGCDGPCSLPGATVAVVACSR